MNVVTSTEAAARSIGERGPVHQTMPGCSARVFGDTSSRCACSSVPQPRGNTSRGSLVTRALPRPAGLSRRTVSLTDVLEAFLPEGTLRFRNRLLDVCIVDLGCTISDGPVRRLPENSDAVASVPSCRDGDEHALAYEGIRIGIRECEPCRILETHREEFYQS